MEKCPLLSVASGVKGKRIVFRSCNSYINMKWRLKIQAYNGYSLTILISVTKLSLSVMETVQISCKSTFDKEQVEDGLIQLQSGKAGKWSLGQLGYLTWRFKDSRFCICWFRIWNLKNGKVADCAIGKICILFPLFFGASVQHYLQSSRLHMSMFNVIVLTKVQLRWSLRRCALA